MRTTISTKQRFHLIGRQVCAAALIASFIFAPHLLATSMAQSEDPKNKKPAPEPASSLIVDSYTLKPTITYTEIHKRGNRDTEKAWRSGQQCLEKGVSRLPQSEQEELMSLTLEAIRVLDESDQQFYQKVMEKSKTEQLPDDYEMRMIESRFRGISRLPDEKRRSAEALYNRAATLGTELP